MNAAETLGEDGEATGGDVTVVGRGDQVADRLDLVEGQLLGRRLGARGLIGEFALLSPASPRVIARRRHPKTAEQARQRGVLAPTVDGSDQEVLLTFVETPSLEIEARQVQQRDDESKQRTELGQSPAKQDDLRLELLGLPVEDVERNDGTFMREPTSSGRRRHTEIGGNARITDPPNHLPKSVIVTSAAPRREIEHISIVAGANRSSRAVANARARNLSNSVRMESRPYVARSFVRTSICCF